MGMVFAARRTAIEPEQFDFIVEEDEYRLLKPGEQRMPGDVVAYRHGTEVVHVAKIVRIEVTPHGAGLTVVSKWGRLGEYIHAAEDLPEQYKIPREPRIEIWTDRK
jgi:hypothetical protein